MKKIILFAFSLLFLTAVVPILSGADIKADKKSTETLPHTLNTNSKTENPPLTDEDVQNILCTVLGYIDKNSTTEYKKAVIVLCENNYIYLKNNESIPEIKISRYSDEEYDEIKKLYNTMHTKLRYNNELVYIPILKNSGTHSETSDEYPYISSVATPWDVFAYDYNDDISYPCGISLYGINYLCGEGYDYKSAISWYLPGFEFHDT